MIESLTYMYRPILLLLNLLLLDKAYERCCNYSGYQEDVFWTKLIKYPCYFMLIKLTKTSGPSGGSQISNRSTRGPQVAWFQNAALSSNTRFQQSVYLNQNIGYTNPNLAEGSNRRRLYSPCFWDLSARNLTNIKEIIVLNDRLLCYESSHFKEWLTRDWRFSSSGNMRVAWRFGIVSRYG